MMILPALAGWGTNATAYPKKAALFRPSRTWSIPRSLLTQSKQLTHVWQTSRIIDPALSPQSHYEALKFLLHFLGDIHQPLHTEAEDRGGNEIHVLFNKKHTNLHSIWDNEILEAHAGSGPKGAEKEDAASWADALFSTTGAEATECDDIVQTEKCALEWANEANAYVCNYVLKDDVEGVEGKNLATEYYQGAVPIVDLLIGKAGLRLGAWINAIAASATAQEMLGDGELWPSSWLCLISEYRLIPNCVFKKSGC